MTFEVKDLAFGILDESMGDNVWLAPRITALRDQSYASRVVPMTVDGSKRTGDPDTVIDDRNEITVHIDYPLSNPCKLHIGGGPITVERFCKAVSSMYHVIYSDEEKTTDVPVGNIPGMMNRKTTDGRYGLWGHTIDNLWLEGAVRMPDGTWRLMMGS